MLSQSQHAVHALKCAIANNDHWPLGLGEQVACFFKSRRRRANTEIGHTPFWFVCFGIFSRRCRLHIVRENQMADAALDDCGLDRLRHEQRMIRAGMHRFGKLCDAFKGRFQINVLKGVHTDHLILNLPGERERRRAIDFRIPEASQKICRPRPGNGQRGGRMSGQFAIT